MHREACVVVNGMSLMGRRGQTKQLHREAYSLIVSTIPPTKKPGVCHHFRKYGMNSLVARMPVAEPGKTKKQNKINFKKRTSVNP